MIHIKAFVVGTFAIGVPGAALYAILAYDLVGWVLALLGAAGIYCAGRVIIA
jgi:hypothetical protein